jgi:hypothetical protein
VLGYALKRLSESDQQALFLRFYEEHEFREIGTTLGIEERAAQKRVYRAMDRLRGYLKKRCIVATAAIFSGQLFTAGACPAPTHLAANLSTNALAVAAKPLSLATVLESIRWSSLLLVGGTALTLGVGASVWKPLGSASEPDAEQLRATTSLVASRSVNPTGDRLAIDDIEGIYRLKPQAKETALVALTDYLQSPHSEDYLVDLFTRWTRLDAARSAQAIVDIASALPDATREDQLAALLQIPLQEWWETNATEAEEWQQSLPRSKRGERVAFTALIRIASLAAPCMRSH